MGVIRIETDGSLPNRSKVFGPADNGHAQLVTEALEWMVTVVLTDAIAQDHRLHDEGQVPPEGWPSGWPI